MSDSFELADRIVELDKKVTNNSLEASKKSLDNLLYNTDLVILNLAALKNIKDDSLLQLVQGDPT